MLEDALVTERRFGPSPTAEVSGVLRKKVLVRALRGEPERPGTTSSHPPVFSVIVGGHHGHHVLFRPHVEKDGIRFEIYGKTPKISPLPIRKEHHRVAGKALPGQMSSSFDQVLQITAHELKPLSPSEREAVEATLLDILRRDLYARQKARMQGVWGHVSRASEEFRESLPVSADAGTPRGSDAQKDVPFYERTYNLGKELPSGALDGYVPAFALLRAGFEFQRALHSKLPRDLKESIAEGDVPKFVRVKLYNLEKNYQAHLDRALDGQPLRVVFHHVK